MICDQNVERYIRTLHFDTALTDERGELFERIANLKQRHRTGTRTLYTVHSPGAFQRRFQPYCALDRERFHKIVRLEVQMIDGGVRTERVVSHAEVIVGFRDSAAMYSAGSKFPGVICCGSASVTRGHSNTPIFDGRHVDQDDRRLHPQPRPFQRWTAHVGLAPA